MAHSLPGSRPVDLTKCGICKEIITDPRALPCLHTYCLDCLREWVRDNKDTVTCPVCKKHVALPSEGVDGLPGNFFVSSMLDRSLPSPIIHPVCVCCGEKINTLKARCVDCNGFLCQKGVDLHKTFKIMQSHQVISIDDLKFGKINVRKMSKPPNCSKHKDQTLWLFCETCGVLICQGCTVLDHCRPEHNYVDLESVVAGQKEKIHEFDGNCDAVTLQITDELEQIVIAKKRFDISVAHASLGIDEAAERFKKHIDDIAKEKKDEVETWRKQTGEEFVKAENALESKNVRLRTAQAMAKQVLSSGTHCDVASVYSQLTTSFQEFTHWKTMIPKCGIYDVQFTSAATLPGPESTIGILKCRRAEAMSITSGKWELELNIGRPNVLTCPRGIAITSVGDVAVSNWDSSTPPVKVYNIDGQLKLSLDWQSRNAYGIAVAENGKMFVTGQCVTVYSPQYKHIAHFNTVSPNGVSSAKGTNLRGIAIDSHGNLMIGNYNNKYISVHDQTGTHLRSFGVDIASSFIAVTNNNNVVVTSWLHSSVHVLNQDGKKLFAIDAPKDVNKWQPTGVCIAKNNEICIANCKAGSEGVYCYTEDGEYMGCITKEVKDPRGIVCIDDQTMAIVDGKENCVKIFKHKL